MLTPSCGMGTYTVGEADRVVNLLLELADLVRQRAGL